MENRYSKYRILLSGFSECANNTLFNTLNWKCSFLGPLIHVGIVIIVIIIAANIPLCLRLPTERGRATDSV